MMIAHTMQSPICSMLLTPDRLTRPTKTATCTRRCLLETSRTKLQNKMAARLYIRVLHRDLLRCLSLTCRRLQPIQTTASVLYEESPRTADRIKSDVKINSMNIPGYMQARIDSGIQSIPSHEQLTDQPLHSLMAMPFNIISAGKFVIHALKKFDCKNVIILVRVPVLVTELCLELSEHGITSVNVSSLAKQEAEVHAGKEFIIVSSYQEANTNVFPQADLILMVQPPMDGMNSAIRFLSRQNFISSSGKAVMLYDENDVDCLGTIQQLTEVIKIDPPSFYIETRDTRDIIPPNPLPDLPSLIREHPLTEMEKPLPEKIPEYFIHQPVIQVRRDKTGRKKLTDHVRLYVRGGSGGQGAPTYSGLGGNGGNVVILCKKQATFDHFALKENRRVIACHGGHYRKEKKKQKGVRGRDVVVPVPPGTTVTTDDGEVLAEMNAVGSRLLVASGGQGGNPSTDWLGEKGERRMIRLDHKLMADVGLVGFPNAGKSSLLGELSRSSVKAGDFPFTTLRPAIGMMEFPDHSQVSVADLPGLVEGAHLNRGMGHRFLKHVDKTSVLVLLVDISGFQLSDQHPKRSAFQSLCLLAKELYSYNNRLAFKPKILVVSKMDSDGADNMYNALLDELSLLKDRGLSNVLEDIQADDKIQRLEAERSTGQIVSDRLEFDNIIPISVISGTGIQHLKDTLKEAVME